MRTLPNAALFLLAVLGGLYFGLFSCGGYAWEWDAFLALAGIGAIAAVAAPRRVSLFSRFGLVFLAVVTFVLVQAAATPFYPSAPASLNNYVVEFVRALGSWAC